MHLGGSRHGKMSKAEARKVLQKGKINGKALTERQEHYFKHIAGGDVNFKKNKPVMKFNEGGEYELTEQEIQELIKQGYKIDIQ
jgi:hypothetical protein